MSVLPRPRCIRRNWSAKPIELVEAAEIAERYNMAWTGEWGAITEARQWKVTRGNMRGSLRRLDLAFANGKTCSLRISGGYYTLRCGAESCR